MIQRAHKVILRDRLTRHIEDGFNDVRQILRDHAVKPCLCSIVYRHSLHRAPPGCARGATAEAADESSSQFLPCSVVGLTGRQMTGYPASIGAQWTACTQAHDAHRA